MFKRSLGIAAASVAVMIVGAAAPASAASKVVQDAQGDAQPRYDITSATFTNWDTRLSATARVDNLRYGGNQYFSLTFSPRNAPDVSYTASTRLRADNVLINRLTVHNELGETNRVPCNVTGIWSPEGDRVRVWVPRSCLEGLSGAQFMRAHLGPSSLAASQDHVRGGFVRQG